MYACDDSDAYGGGCFRSGAVRRDVVEAEVIADEGMVGVEVCGHDVVGVVGTEWRVGARGKQAATGGVERWRVLVVVVPLETLDEL